MRPSEALAELQLSLPPVAKPVAAYIPTIVVGNQVWTSGQLPFSDGELLATGLVGDEVDLETATACARQAGLNALAAIAAECGGVDAIGRILKVVVYVASSTDFVSQPQVANGVSELLGQIFADAGRHVRSAVGVAVLPLNAPVEVELVAEIATF